MRTRHALLFLGLSGAAVAVWLLWGRRHNGRSVARQLASALREARDRLNRLKAAITRVSCGVAGPQRRCRSEVGFAPAQTHL
jgi:hypothetical protein